MYVRLSSPKTFLALFMPLLLILTACGAGGGGGESVGGGEGGEGDSGDDGTGGGDDGSGGGSGGGVTDPPLADFDATNRSGPAPLTVVFADGSTGTIDTWSWDFGDGQTSTAQDPVHTYTTPGTYDVALTVTGPDGSDTHIEPGFVTLSAGVDCSAEDATFNTNFPIKEGAYDFVPVTPDGRGLWCIYSVRDREDGSAGVGNNVGIFLLELDPANVLMFGSGYGDIKFGGQGPLHDAAFDMAMVDEVIQGCMGRIPSQTTIQFWTPHGHPDHVHSAGFRELRNLNYAVSDIYYHDADEGAVAGSAGWTSQDLGIFRPISGPDCSTALWTSPGDLGWIWVMRRSGHTSGSVDVVIDVDGNTNDRVVVLGSADNNLCDSFLSGVRFEINAHGNVRIP